MYWQIEDKKTLKKSYSFFTHIKSYLRKDLTIKLGCFTKLFDEQVEGKYIEIALKLLGR